MIEQTQIIEVTADTLIRTGPGLVYSIQVCADGVTAGDSVELVDGLTGAGTTRWRFIANATDQTHSYCPSNPARFNTGIYVDVTLTGGAVYVTVQYS